MIVQLPARCTLARFVHFPTLLTATSWKFDFMWICHTHLAGLTSVVGFVADNLVADITG